MRRLLICATLLAAIFFEVPSSSSAYTEADYKAAIDLATKRIDLDPSYVLGYSARGSSYLGLGKYREAEKDFLQAISLKPSDPRNYALLASLYSDQKRWHEGLKAIKQAIALGDHQQETLNLELALLSSTSKNQECFQKCLEAIKLYPDDSKAFFYKAMSKRALGTSNLKEQESDLATAVRLDPLNIPARNEHNLVLKKLHCVRSTDR